MDAEKLYALTDEVEERIGTKKLLEELELGLGTDKLEFYIKSICRDYDIRYDDKTGEIIEEDED